MGRVPYSNRREVARRTKVGYTSVYDALQRHAARLASDAAYDDLVGRVLRDAVRRSLPLPSHAFDLPMRVGRGSETPLVIAATA